MQTTDQQTIHYFDYAATTPADPRVVAVMQRYLGLEGHFGNPASRSHAYGWEAEKAVENARAAVASLVNCEAREIVWTSGATESDNLAIKGAAHFYQRRGKHIITAKTEHKAVLDSCRFLEGEGFEVTYLEPDDKGLISVEKIEAALREDTILISIMHVNNEIGVIQDIAAIGELARAKSVLFHVDAAQSLGKVAIDLQSMKVDLMSFSGHKVYGPKGIGALYIRRKPRVRLESQIHGGGQERGFRSGTLAPHQIAGFGEACRVAKEDFEKDHQHIQSLAMRLWNGVKDMEAIRLNSNLENGYLGIMNISFNYIEGESLLMALKCLAISSGSACTSASLEPSYVLRALGLSDELAHSSLRFSIGRFTTEEQIDFAIKEVRASVTRLREMSPLWEMYKEGVDLDAVEWAAH